MMLLQVCAMVSTPDETRSQEQTDDHRDGHCAKYDPHECDENPLRDNGQELRIAAYE